MVTMFVNVNNMYKVVARIDSNIFSSIWEFDSSAMRQQQLLFIHTERGYIFTLPELYFF